SGSVLQDQAGEAIGKVWVLNDLTAQRTAETEKHELEDWIRHSQKLETLGVMAGGIAHDFNNLLTVIQGNAELAEMKTSENAGIGEELQKILEVTDHAAELTNQMLTYAGRGKSARTQVDLNLLCQEISELLKTAVSKKAELKMEFADNLPSLVADRSQLSQVIMNLVTNASDALGDNPGLITLKTGTIERRDNISGLRGKDAPYVTLEVVDSGSGMDEKTRERMFDPFYTTKFTGRGLGLANVMGIVQAHGGMIKVTSKPGTGTTVKVALPPGVNPAQKPVPVAIQPDWHGSGVALLVDDDAALRSMAAGMLKRAGYQVVEACDGKQAVEIYRSRKRDISFILLDITMPVMDGREALAEIRSISKDVPVILMSGYSMEEVDVSGDKLAWFLSKPFRYSALSESIHTAIAGNPDYRMH
ncbi:MAG: response regulator, partial [Gammaproteobacteria bacterium]|nr:response regulator [Gammaproteobacteria bacterium]